MEMLTHTKSSRTKIFMCKVMSIIWYSQGNDEKTAKGGVTAFLDLKC